MKTITIKFDEEKNRIVKVEGLSEINPIDITKILLTVSLTSLNKIVLKPVNKIITPDKKIIGGHHG